MITLTDTYRHLDGTPGTGRVLLRTVTAFHDSKGTVIPTWVAYPLAADGSVSITIDSDLEHADPGPQWLQIIEDVDCARHGVWEIGPDVLFAGPDPTITLGLVRQLPALGDTPRYIPVPGPTGATGATGATGPKGDPGQDGFPPPAGGNDGDVLQLQGSPGTPVWTGNLGTALTRTDYLQQQLNDLMLATPTVYNPAQAYQAGDVVSYQGQLYAAKRDIAAGNDPVSHAGQWLSLALEDIAAKAFNAQNGLDDKVDKAGDTMTGPLVVPLPTAAQQVPRLARTPNPATGDLGLPGYAGSDTGWRDVSADLRTGWTGTLYVRRLGAQIVVRGVLDASAATSNQPWSLAPGFRTITTLVPIGQGVPAGIDGINHVAAGDDGGRSRIILAGGYLTVFRVGQSVGDFVAQWISDDDWPSNLPGTQVTAPATWT